MVNKFSMNISELKYQRVQCNLDHMIFILVFIFLHLSKNTALVTQGMNQTTMTFMITHATVLILPHDLGKTRTLNNNWDVYFCFQSCVFFNIAYTSANECCEDKEKYLGTSWFACWSGSTLFLFFDVIDRWDEVYCNFLWKLINWTDTCIVLRI